MTRIAWLLPLSLGLLIACDAQPTAPDPAAADPALVQLPDVDLGVVMDIQPLGDVEKAVVQMAKLHVAVAVLGSADFDVHTLDLATVRFAGAAEMHAEQSVSDDPNCPEKFAAGHYRDVDLDLITDLVLHFATADVDPAVVAEEGWCLTGADLDGATFGVCDTNVIVK